MSVRDKVNAGDELGGLERELAELHARTDAADVEAGRLRAACEWGLASSKADEIRQARDKARQLETRIARLRSPA